MENKEVKVGEAEKNKEAKSDEKKNDSSFARRSITSVVYVVVLIGLIVLKWLVPDNFGALGFDAVFCAVSVLGCLEVLRAVGGVSYVQKAATVAFCAAAVPLYVVAQILMELGVIAVCALALVFVLVLAAVNIFNFGTSTVKGSAISLFTFVYCGVLPCSFAALNHLQDNSLAAVLLLFLSTILTDSFAYVIGTVFKRWVPYKLAPRISPNKTIIGGVGGIVGGIIGAVAACFINYGLGRVTHFELVYSGALPAIVVFILIGFVASVIGQLGDLFESAIKRECGIKDMGNILPGHGGIMDRFDSTLFASLAVAFFFAVVL